VDVARLMYAASSWRGLTKASDRQRINLVIDRARRHGYCSPDLPTFDDLCDAAGDELFAIAARLSNHVLHALLPPPSTASQRYDLRQRIHSLQLPQHSTHLSDCNFLMRMLYKTNTRPTQFQLYPSLPHIAFTNTIFVYFRVLFIVLSLRVACILSCHNQTNIDDDDDDDDLWPWPWSWP